MVQDYEYGPYQSRPRELNHASVLRRIGAYLIDVIILGFLMGAILGILFVIGLWSLEEVQLEEFFELYLGGIFLIIISLNLITFLVYFTYFESKSGGGSTFAKRIFNIEVVDKHGKKVSMGTSFIRNIARLLWSIPCIGFIILIIDVFLVADKNQRIGDSLANTYVVKRERGSIYKEQYQNYSPSNYGRQQVQEYNYQQRPMSQTRG